MNFFDHYKFWRYKDFGEQWDTEGCIMMYAATFIFTVATALFLAITVEIFKMSHANIFFPIAWTGVASVIVYGLALKLIAYLSRV